MAPRTVKVKKGSDKNEAEILKKGRGKAKNIEDLGDMEEEFQENEINENVHSEKKAKRGRKALESNGQIEKNDISEEIIPPPKKSKKKPNSPENENNDPDKGSPQEKEMIPPPKKSKKKPNSPENENNDPGKGSPQEKEMTGDSDGPNGYSEEAEMTDGKGKKKQPKNTSSKTIEKGKKKSKQETPKVEEENQEPPKPAAKGRGRKPKNDKPIEDKTEVSENVKTASLTKGKKKVQIEVLKEDTSEPKEESKEDSDENVGVKKETKGKKTQAKNAKKTEDNNDVQKEELTLSNKKINIKKAQGDGSEDAHNEPAEPRSVKGKRGQKKAESGPADKEDQDTGESISKRRRKAPEEKVSIADSKKKAPLKNKASTNYDKIDFTNQSKNEKRKEWNFKIASWNVDGIRAWMTKGGLDYIKYEKPDILCMQEVKCPKQKLPNEVAEIPGYHAYWLCSEKDGYAGVGIYTTKLAMNVQYGLHNEELDDEGRIITAEYEDFYLICTYVPNAGRKLVTLPKRLQWNKEFRKFVNELDKKKPVIICGDMNVAHNEIDLANPKSNRKNAGFTIEERAGMTDLLGDGFVDTYRRLSPEKTGAYTFWTYMMNSRSKNVGWRLDYFIVSERLMPSVCDSVIRSEVYGSDHCPISLFLHVTSAEKPKE